VLLVLALLGGGLVSLLLLSSASSADAFTHRKLQQDNRELSIKEQELGREVAASEAPRAIASRAREMGLVPAADPGFLVVEPGRQAKVVGSPVPATSPPPPPEPTPSATPTSSAGPSAAGPGTPPAGSANPGGPAGSANPPTPAPPAGRRTPGPTPTPGGTR